MQRADTRACAVILLHPDDDDHRLGSRPFAVGLMSDITHDLAGSILNLYWMAPLIAA
jgi:hypothetical protein